MLLALSVEETTVVREEGQLTMAVKELFGWVGAEILP